MGIKLKEECDPVRHIIQMDDLRGQKIGVDTYNYLYSSLYATRTTDGTPLLFGDKVTSHITFFFYKTIQMFELGIKPVYIFDGKKSVLKSETMSERKQARDAIRQQAEEAKQRGDIELYNRLMTSSQSVQPYMIDDLKRMFTLFGIPWVQATSEGEAQGSYMCSRGDLFGMASQDYDCILFGAKIFLRNIYRAKTTKIYGKEIVNEKEQIVLSELLDRLGMSRRQLVDVAILSGTDFNKGVHKVGIKTAIKHIRKYGSLERAIENVEIIRKNLTKDVVNQVRQIFLEPKVVDSYTLKFSMPKFDDIETMMIDEFGFSEQFLQPKILSLRRTLTARATNAVAKL